MIIALIVKKTDQSVSMYRNNLLLSEMDKKTGLSTCEYITIAEKPFQLINIENVLLGGLGGGTIIRHIQKYSSNVEQFNIDVVELDDEVIQCARKNFIGPDGKNSMELDDNGIAVNIINGDFSLFLTNTTTIYDYIFIDCFYEPSTKRLWQQNNLIKKSF